MGAWQTKIPEVTRRMEGSATRSALKAGGEVVLEAIQGKLEGGFTTGAFTTGLLARQSVKRPRPTPKEQRVTTTNPVLIAWSVGHHNIFTRRFERVDHFTAAVNEQRHAIGEAFARRYKEKLLELIAKAQKR